MSLTAGGGPSGLGVALAPLPHLPQLLGLLDSAGTPVVSGGGTALVGERGVSATGLVAVPLLRVALAFLPPGGAGGSPHI